MEGPKSDGCSVHKAGCLDSPHVPLKFWKIPEDPLVFSVCWSLMSPKRDAAATVEWVVAAVTRNSRRQATLLLPGPLCIWSTYWKVFPILLGCYRTQLILHGTALIHAPEAGLLVDSRSLQVNKINSTCPPSHAWPVGVAWRSLSEVCPTGGTISLCCSPVISTVNQ